MTVRNLIRILDEYACLYGQDTYVVLANDEDIIGDADAVGMSDNGEIIITIE